MNTIKYQRDAVRIADELPSFAPVAHRVEYLVGNVSRRSLEVSRANFEQPVQAVQEYDREKVFFSTNREELKASQSQLGRLARELAGVMFVAHSPVVPSVLVLPPHEAGMSKGNGLGFLHELEHITEVEEGMMAASSGVREQRAYGLNAAILGQIDGSDFARYVDAWPVSLESSNGITNFEFHDDVCPIPPNETFIHEVWAEGSSSRRILQSIGRATAFEKTTADLPAFIKDQLADGINNN